MQPLLPKSGRALVRGGEAMRTADPGNPMRLSKEMHVGFALLRTANPADSFISQ